MYHRLFVALLLGTLALSPARGQVPSAGADPKAATSKAYLGISAEPTPDGANHAGLVVRGVSPGSPAARAGLRPSDVIVKIGDQPAKDFAALAHAVANHKPGDQLTLRVLRDGKEQDLAVTLAGQPQVERPRIERFFREWHGAFLGVQTGKLTPELRGRLGVAADQGVVITEVLPDTPAALAGLKPDDVITGVNGKAVATPDDLREAIRKAGAGKDVSLSVLRGQTKQEVKARLGEEQAEFSGLEEFQNLPRFVEAARKMRELEHRVQEVERRLHDMEQKLIHPKK